MKAQYLLNVARLVEWPVAPEGKEEEVFLLGILGRDPFEGLFRSEEAVQIQRRRLVVRRSRNVRDLAECHAVYVSASESGDLARILGTFQDLPILTFGEGNAFLAEGGVVQFVYDKGRIRLRVNRRAAVAVGLRFNSHLLRMVEVVGE